MDVEEKSDLELNSVQVDYSCRMEEPMLLSFDGLEANTSCHGLTEIGSRTGGDERKGRCLICWRSFDGISKGIQKSSLDQLNELLQIFSIDLPSFEHLGEDDPPAKIFCGACAEKVFVALDILSRIEALRKDLKIVTTILQEYLLRSQAVDLDDYDSKWMCHVRKMLIQCIYSCDNPVSNVQGKKNEQEPLEASLVLSESDKIRRQENSAVEKFQLEFNSPNSDLTMKMKTEIVERNKERNNPPTTGAPVGESSNVSPAFALSGDNRMIKAEFEDNDSETFVDDHFMRVLCPETILTTELTNQNKSIPEERIKFLERGDFVSEELENFDLKTNEHVTELPSEHEVEIDWTSEASSAREQNIGCDDPIRLKCNPTFLNQSSNWNNGQLISTVCCYCEKTLSQEDYVTESGSYVFKCRSEHKCNKILSTFTKLVVHHEACCAAKPESLRSVALNRKLKGIPRSVSTEVQDKQGHLWTYDQQRKVKGFECGQCGQQLSRSDYTDDAETFVFKCNWGGYCRKITATFPNLCYHHTSHCLGSARNALFKSQGSEISAPVDPSENRQRSYQNHVDEQTILECPKCEQTLTLVDCIDESNNTYIYKCPPTCCSEVFTSFPDVMSHHEPRCKPVDVNIPNGECINVEAEFTGGSYDRAPATAQLLSTSESLDSFKCKFCDKEYKKEDLQHEISGTKVFNCLIPNCGKIFSSFSVFRCHHLTTCLTRWTVEFACDLCNQIYSCKNDLLLHKIGAHTNSKYPCKICGLGFLNETDLKIHSTTHPNKYKCQRCSNCYKSKVSLVKHQTRAHNLRTFSNRVYDKKSSLVSFDCPHCLRKLSKSDYLNESGKYVFKCFQHCGKIKHSFGTLIYHHESFCAALARQLERKTRGIQEESQDHQKLLDVSPSGELADEIGDYLSDNFVIPDSVSSDEEFLKPQEDEDFPILNDVPQLKRDHLVSAEPRSDVSRSLDAACSDDDSAAYSFDCSNCQRNLAIEDYATETDDYFFKCLSDGCEEVAEDFPSLVLHHQQCCPSKPADRNKEVKCNVESDNICSQHQDLQNSLVSKTSEDNRIFDETGTLITFNCPICKISISRNNYSVEVGNYLYNTFPCDFSQTGDNFVNIVSHHEACCVSHPSKAKITAKRCKKSALQVNPLSCAGVSTTTANRVFDEDGVVVSYDCPFCHKNFSSETYSAGIIAFLYRCLPDSFHGDNFNSLVSHHENFCSSKFTARKGGKVSKSPKNTTEHNRTTNQSLSSENELTQERLGKNGLIYDDLNLLVAFQCPQCEKQMSRSDFLVDKGKYFFRCTDDVSCKKTTRHFAQLTYHHRAHCVSRVPPLKRKWMRPHKWMRKD